MGGKLFDEHCRGFPRGECLRLRTIVLLAWLWIATRENGVTHMYKLDIYGSNEK
jgi:hypothetical protein